VHLGHCLACVCALCVFSVCVCVCVGGGEFLSSAGVHVDFLDHLSYVNSAV